MFSYRISNANLAVPLLQPNYDKFISPLATVYEEFEVENTMIIMAGESIKNTTPFFQGAKWRKSLSYLAEKEISIKEWLDLYMIFRNKFNSKAHLFQNETAEQVEADFKRAAEYIFNLSPDVVSVEVTDDECIFIYAEFGNRNVFFNIFYDDEGREIQLNLIKDKKPIASVSGDMKTALVELKNFVYGQYGEDQYAISGTPNTEIYI